MSSFEIILICILLAYFFMKVREYTLATKKITTGRRSEKDKTTTIKEFRSKLTSIELKLYKLHESKQNFEAQPVSHKVKKQIHKLDSQIAKLEQAKTGYTEALAEYQEIINSKEKNAKFNNILRSYLNNKYHL